jgi:hypothetical protein
MGYIIELRAGFLDRLVAELTDPTLPAPKPSKQDSIYTKEVRERWGELQRVVAEQARMTDDVVAGPDVATYITEVINQTCRFWNSIQHSSSGGDDFLDGMDEVTPYLGFDFVSNLMRRPILGITTDDYPFFGYATNAELRTVVDQASDQMPPLAEQDESLRTIFSTARNAALRGVDIITVYA